MSTDLRAFSREQLLEATKRVVKIEKDSTIEAIRHFAEINRRNLYLDCGYESLFDMLVNFFGYCRASAHIRVSSMRLINDVPEVQQKIETGELTLSTAAQVQSFFSAEKKAAKAYTPEQKLELIETCSRKSSREIERELSLRNPQIFKKELVRVVSEHYSRMNISISNDVLDNLEKVKALLSHQNPNMSYDDLLRKMAEIVLDKIDPERRAKRAQTKRHKGGTLQTTSYPSARHIDAATRHAVWLKNSGKGCEYVDHSTNKRCGSKFQLQIDHIMPISAGGSSDENNLRVLCARHNRWRHQNNR